MGKEGRRQGLKLGSYRNRWSESRARNRWRIGLLGPGGTVYYVRVNFDGLLSQVFERG